MYILFLSLIHNHNNYTSNSVQNEKFWKWIGDNSSYEVLYFHLLPNLVQTLKV